MRKYIIVFIFVLFGPFVFFHFSRDASVYAYMGSLLFEGKIPYIDAWDHKGISLYLINALGYLIGFKEYIGIRILEIALILFATLHTYTTLAKKYTKGKAIIAILFGLLTFKYFFEGGNITEEYGALSALFSLSLYLRNKKASSTYLTLGALFVFNLTIRANLIAFWIAFFFALIINAFLNKEAFKEVLKKLIAMLVGVTLFLGILAIYFSITDSFSQFYDAAFTYNFSYSKQPISSLFAAIIKSMRRYELSIIMLFAFSISLVSLFKKRITFLELLILVWVPLELFFTNMSGKMFAHYYMMWFPIVVVSIILILTTFKEVLKEKEKQYLLLFTTVFFFFQIPLFESLNHVKKVFSKTISRNEKNANHILKKYKDKSLLVWGNESAIYNLTKKRATVSNFYQTLFKINTPLTKEMITNFTKQIKTNPPDLIVDTKTNSLLFLNKENKTKVSAHQQESLKVFFEFIAINYKLVESVNGADYYVFNH